MSITRHGRPTAVLLAGDDGAADDTVELRELVARRRRAGADRRTPPTAPDRMEDVARIVVVVDIAHHRDMYGHR